MKTLMTIVLLAFAVVAGADDGRVYRICGLDDDGRLRLVESRKREVRPVVALPVVEEPLAKASFASGEKLDDFDCEALENHLGVVRPVAESEDGRNPAFRDFLEQGITNRVMQQLTSPKLGTGTIDIQHLKLVYRDQGRLDGTSRALSAGLFRHRGQDSCDSLSPGAAGRRA